MRRRLGVGLGAVAAVAVAACALELTGIQGEVLLPDASVDGAIVGPGSDSSSPGDGGTGDARDALVEARPDPRVVCPRACEEAGVGKCDDAGTCTIDCKGDNSCDAGVTCPTDVGCVVACGGQYACKGKIDCAGAVSCDVQCNGYSACRDDVSCGRAERCAIGCTNQFSCSQSTIYAEQSASSEIQCTGYNACAGVRCAGQRCHVVCSDQYNCDKGSVQCVDTNATPQADAGCILECTGYSSCGSDAGVLCRGARCDVKCDNQYSCYDGVRTSAAQSTIDCTGFSACYVNASCDGGTCGIACGGSGCNQFGGSGAICCKAGTCTGPTANTCP